MAGQARSTLGFLLLGAMLACGGDESVPAPESASEPVLAPALVESDNEAPVIESVRLVPEEPRPGARLRAQVEASDPDGDTVRLFYEWRVDGERTTDRGDSFHVPAAGASEIEVWVTARDGETASDPVSRLAYVANLPPQIVGVVIEPSGELTVASDLLASPRANDPDGDSISYRFAWTVNDRRAGGDRPTLEARSFERGDRIGLSVVASDAQGESEPFSIDPITVANSPPTITSRPGGFEGDDVLRYEVSATDPDGDRRFRFELIEGPDGMQMDRVTGDLSWAPREDQSGTHAVEIQVSDGRGGTAVQAFEASVAVEEQPDPAAPAPAVE